MMFDVCFVMMQLRTAFGKCMYNYLWERDRKKEGKKHTIFSIKPE